MLQYGREGFPLKENKRDKREKDVTPSGIFLCGTFILGVKKAWFALANGHDNVIMDYHISYNFNSDQVKILNKICFDRINEKSEQRENRKVTN